MTKTVDAGSTVLDMDTVNNTMRWDMAVLGESPWRQEILAEGMESGMERGREAEAANMVQMGAPPPLRRYTAWNGRNRPTALSV